LALIANVSSTDIMPTVWDYRTCYLTTSVVRHCEQNACCVSNIAYLSLYNADG